MIIRNYKDMVLYMYNSSLGAFCIK